LRNSRTVGRLSCLALAAVGLLGCSPVVETDQARLCRMALPALMGDGVAIDVLDESPDPDGRGLTVGFSAATPGEAPERHRLACRFRSPGRPRESRDLVALTLDGEPVGAARIYVLVRWWLSTPEGRAADPDPIAAMGRAPALPRTAAYAVQMAVDGLPRAAVYALLAAAYSLIYGLVGRINFAFGELAAAGGYGAAMTALALARLPPAPLLAAAFVMAGLVALGWGYATARCVFLPLRQARGQQTLVATVGLAVFLQELLRIAQGDRTSWMAPVLNQPFALARSPGYVAVASPMTFVSSGVALAVAVALVALFRGTRAGREWRAFADDPLAAEMLGVSPAVTVARAFALSGALAGLAGAIMTAAFGAVGYALSASLTLKALAAAVVGGIGSLPGAFLGGLLIGALETGWSAAFPIDDRDIAVYAVLILFVALRPSGLLGRPALQGGLRQARS
jgi:branched-chain amino acid transport system permease protein